MMPSNIFTFILSEWLTFNPKATECPLCPDAVKDNNILTWITTYLYNKTRITPEFNIDDWLTFRHEDLAWDATAYKKLNFCSKIAEFWQFLLVWSTWNIKSAFGCHPTVCKLYCDIFHQLVTGTKSYLILLIMDSTSSQTDLTETFMKS